jgi:hypothetical protein
VLRNGTSAEVAGVAYRGGRVVLRLEHGRLAALDRGQIEQADLRLAYVQHPFPAQGQTTDTAHLIVAEHASREGSYVGLTRARERTDLYASVEGLEAALERELGDGSDRLAAVAEAIGRTEEVVPSIDMPLAHEAAVEAEVEMERGEGGRSAGERGEAERGGIERGEAERRDAEREGVRAVERDDALERDDGVGFEL